MQGSSKEICDQEIWDFSSQFLKNALFSIFFSRFKGNCLRKVCGIFLDSNIGLAKLKATYYTGMVPIFGKQLCI